MFRAATIGCCLLALSSLTLASCDGDDDTDGGNAGSAGNAGSGSGAEGGAGGSPSEELTPCLDRPEDLPRAPNGQLPCDLLPPGFSG